MKFPISSRSRSAWRGASIVALGVAAFLVMSRTGSAETRAQTCDRLASDAVKLDAIDGEAAVPSCSDAVAAAPQDKHLQYEYARALERSGKRDEAKQIYQWIADDGYAPASAALARLAGPLTGEAVEREKFAQKLDAIAAIATRIAKSTPRDHDDPNTVLAKRGKDPSKILAWVKANTRIVPYAGMLRGASGVLMDRAGNSLDRALFLADLLHRAGYNVRIARAQISAQAAEALRQRFVSSAPKPAPSAAPDKAALLKAIGNDPRLDPKLIEKAVDETIARSQKFDADVQHLYGKVLPAVLQAIGSDPARDARLAADADAALRDHFWVQRQNGAGWDDFDPDADLAGRLTAAATFFPSETPPDLKHRVTLRLTLETLKDGKLSETPLLQQSWLPSDVVGKPVVINHALYPQLPLDGLLKRPNPQADFIQSLADASVVMPTLQVGAQLTRGQLYDFTGRIEAPTAENLASMGGTAIVNGQGLSRGIASAFGDSAPTPTPVNSSQATVTAEWLEIDVVVPGKPVEKHRRPIFDLIGAVARANPAQIAAPAITDDLRRRCALALTATIDTYVFGATPSGEWIRRVSTDGMARAASMAAKSVRTAQSIADAPPQTANRIEPQLWGWAENRMAATQQSRGAPTAPNIALLWATPAPHTNAQGIVEIGFDIVTNDAASDTTFTHRVAQGVIDTIVEHAILPGPATDVNAAVQHVTDITAGRKWIALDTANSETANQLSLPAEEKTSIISALKSGDIVIAPAEAGSANGGQSSWWQIDGRTGQTVGTDQSGKGDAMVEFGQVVRIVISNGRTYRLLGCAVSGIYSVAADQGKISYRTAAEAVGCTLYSIYSPVPGAGKVAQEILGGLLWSVATSPVEGGEGSESPGGEGKNYSDPSDTTCKSKDQGC